ncbi:sensor histidine kinase [Pseudoduganella danionis]|uniref:Sensor histidine kinase n=1 Tax=Pseudoduganella danionis TaxID=1890295 RepID=A0ABW9SMU7_9BURK|nr:sensor histidine kinase [Pseudoduganella danionis]MTW33512.1 sensor histidine kinase [Pseudoduganella danionis]
MPSQIQTPFPWRRFGADTLYMLGFNLILAIVLTFFFSHGRYFWLTLVATNCIGLCSFFYIDGLRLLLCRKRPEKMNWLVFFPVVITGVPFGTLVGSHISNWLVGTDPVSLSAFGSGRLNGMLLITLVATVVASTLFNNRDRARRAEMAAALEKVRAESIQRQALQAELQLLRAQIEPHMLFNTLANLQGLIAIDPARAQQMLDQLIQFLRATLSSSRTESTTLAEEFALLEAYLGLMAVRMGERLRYAFELPADLRSVRVPPMLLQPLVENAIAHGIEPNIEGGTITISAARQDGMLALSVSDTGRGPHAGAGKPGTGLGLHNTRERIKALYGEAASVTLDAASHGGAIARLTLPL